MDRVDKLSNQLNKHTKSNTHSNQIIHQSQHHGGDLVAHTLHKIGVNTIFTLTGGHISPILVACDQLGIRIIDVRDEATAVFAADAQSRVSDNTPNQPLIPGIAMVTAGSGLTNTITAVKEAQLVESPLILFGGAAPTDLKGRDTLLDVDEIEMMRPYIKWSKTIQSISDIIPTIYEAMNISTSGIPGPVFIECPMDVLWKRMTDNEYQNMIVSASNGTHYSKQSQIAMETENDNNNMIEYERIIHKLESSVAPLIIMGTQCVNAEFPTKRLDELVKAVEIMGIPTYTQGMTRGLLGTEHELHFRHFRTKLSLKECDFLLLLGVHCDFRIDYGRGINPKAFIVAVNLSEDKMKLNNDFRGKDIMYQTHPGWFLVKLAETMKKIHISDRPRICYKEWVKKLKYREENREIEIDKLMVAEERKIPKFIDPIRCCKIINAFINDDKYSKEDIYIIDDAGDFGGTAAYLVRPNRKLHWLDAGTWTLGCGAGFAMGVKAIKPKSTVIVLFGDGGLGWSLSEFDTLARHKLNVIAIVGNNAGWEQIYRAQMPEFHNPVATRLGYTRYDKIVEPFGCKGICVRNVEELRPAFDLAMVYSKDGYPVLMNVMITRSKFRQMILSKM